MRVFIILWSVLTCGQVFCQAYVPFPDSVATWREDEVVDCCGGNGEFDASLIRSEVKSGEESFVAVFTEDEVLHRSFLFDFSISNCDADQRQNGQ